MPDVDFFNFFRYLLGTIVTIYASVVTFQSLYSWWVWLNGGDKYVSLVRRYVLVHALRLRFKTFWGDVIICVLLTGVFALLWRGHTLVNQLGDQLTDLRRPMQNPRHVGPRPAVELEPSGERPSTEPSDPHLDSRRDYGSPAQ